MPAPALGLARLVGGHCEQCLLLAAPKGPLLKPAGCCMAAGAAREFDKRMQHITTEWCCRREEEAKEFDPPLPINVPLAMAPDSSKLSAQPGLDSSC